MDEKIKTGPIMKLGDLQRETSLAQAEMETSQQKLLDAQDKQVFHEKKKLEYSVISRDLSYEFRAKQQRFIRLQINLKNQTDLENLAEEEAQITELKEIQPTFWQILANCLDRLVEDNKEKDIDLSFTPNLKSSNMLVTLKGLTDVRHRGNTPEAVEVFEAMSVFNNLLTDICRDQVRGNGFNASKQKQLKQPILHLLNNPRIKSALSIS